MVRRPGETTSPCAATVYRNDRPTVQPTYQPERTADYILHSSNSTSIRFNRLWIVDWFPSFQRTCAQLRLRPLNEQSKETPPNLKLRKSFKKTRRTKTTTIITIVLILLFKIFLTKKVILESWRFHSAVTTTRTSSVHTCFYIHICIEVHVCTLYPVNQVLDYIRVWLSNKLLTTYTYVIGCPATSRKNKPD